MTSKLYPYQLEPYKGPATRHTCPSCKKKRQFVRYISTSTKEPLRHDVGRCNRENKCAYHYTPRQFFADHKMLYYPSYINRISKLSNHHSPSYISIALFKATLKNYSSNHFVTYLNARLGEDKTQQLIAQFYIGTSKHWLGATVFWQIDTQGQIRTGKIMLYDPYKGTRVKVPFSHIAWVHQALKLKPFYLVQSLFGIHQIIQAPLQKPVAVVESEKTAIIAAAYWPDFIWVAAGSLTGLTPERCKPLEGRKVILFPDAGAYQQWQQRAKTLTQHLDISIKVSDWLEEHISVTDLAQGIDLADYLAQRSYPE
jgi:hypothetical protein